MLKVTEGNIYIKVSKNKVLEISWSFWNPLSHIYFDLGFDVYFKGDHTPKTLIFLAFLFCYIFIDFYDNRHEKEKDE